MHEPADRGRLAALARTELMDSGAEEAFDRFTRMAARVLGTPVALISLVDEERQYFKSALGLDLEQTPLSHSFCRYVVANQAPLVVRDARTDPRLHDNLAIRDLDVIAYCGVPLTDRDGHTLGSLCAIAPEPREWNGYDVTVLRELAAGVMTEIELRTATRALLAHERESRLIADTALDGFVGCDATGAITSWNPAAERLFGWSAEEALGRTVAELIIPEDLREDHLQGFARFIATRQTRIVGRPVELRALHRDRSELFVEMTVGWFESPEGPCFHAVIRDVSVRRATELELAASEERLSRTFDDAPIGIALVAPEGRWLRVNRALTDMLGYDAAELLTLSFQDITHPEDLDADLELVAQVLDGRIPRYQLQKRYLHRDGHVVWANLSVSLVRDAGGTPLHFISHIEDVTASRAAAEELAEERRLLDESQAAGQVGSWSWNLDTGEVSWSDHQFRLHGLDPAHGMPSPDAFLAILHPEDRERTGASMAAAVKRPTAFSDEYRILRGDGVRTFEVRGAFVPGDGTRADRMTGTTRDVTEERAVQAIEQKQSVLLSSLPDTMVVLYDAELRCVLLEGALIDNLGLDRDDYLGKPLSDTVPAERCGRTEAAVKRALAGERSSMEYAAGTGITYSVEFAPYLEDGRIAGAFTVWRDVTERLAQERQGRLLATIVEQSEDAIFTKDRNAIITEWNAGAERLYGWSAEEAIGRPVAMLIPTERAGEDRMLLGRALRGEPVRQYETTRVHRSGQRVDVSLSVSPIRDGAGKFTAAAVIARDITSRIQRDRARLEVEERLRVTVDHAPIGVGLVDLDELGRGRLASANEALAKLLGDPDPVAGGLSLATVVHPDDETELTGALSALRTGLLDRAELEVRCPRGDGHVVWLLVAGAAVPPLLPGEQPRQAVVHVIDIGERKRFEGQLQHLADHDALTGLYNRGRFESELDRAVSHAERYGSRGAVLLIDLDGFKYVNDTMGHSRGDELVTRIAGLLRGAVRETDVVARIGGDEFAVIVTEADEDEGLLVANKILGVLRERAIVLSENRRAKVTASVGVTAFDAASSLTPEELMVEADIAMYEAKEAGKNQAARYRREEDRRSRLAKRESWLERLRQATSNEGFELLAQPIAGICATASGRFELLLRLRSDDGDLIPPGTFLYNAERFDLIQGIDRWVFGQALELLRAHDQAGNDISLSVNMSGKTLNDPQLLEDLSQMMARCPVPPGRLIVEATETAAITNIERAGHVARSLRELGVQFALDDFGAGFASFYYLKHLEFDYLKIDGEFVRSLSRNLTDQLVIKSVVDIARGLGARTIAEFVGDDEAVERLRELGVDYGQGYHLGRPGPVSERLPSLSRAASR